MKTFTTYFFVFLIIVCACDSPDKKSKKNTETRDSLFKFEFTKEIHNFGTLQSGEIVSFNFRLVNTGGASFNIDKVRTNCGCVTTSFTTDVIEAGDTAYLEVTFDPSGETGRVYQEIKVTIKAKGTIEKNLAIVADVNNKLFNYK